MAEGDPEGDARLLASDVQCMQHAVRCRFVGTSGVCDKDAGIDPECLAGCCAIILKSVAVGKLCIKYIKIHKIGGLGVGPPNIKLIPSHRTQAHDTDPTMQ